MTKKKTINLTYCPTCDKDVKALDKMFGTKICPSCNKILSSDMGIDKVGR